jgi:hypothetical protein
VLTVDVILFKGNAENQESSLESSSQLSLKPSSVLISFNSFSCSSLVFLANSTGSIAPNDDSTDSTRKKRFVFKIIKT